MTTRREHFAYTDGTPIRRGDMVRSEDYGRGVVARLATVKVVVRFFGVEKHLDPSAIALVLRNHSA